MKPSPPRSLASARSRAIARMQQRLLRESLPRTQMGLIVALTGAFGLLASFCLLHLGLDRMVLRYPLALGLAYGFFLFLIWLWLRTNAGDYVDLANMADAVPGTGPSPAGAAFRTGSGGDFAGGGASASFDTLAGPLDSPGGAPLESAGDALGSVADADEFAIPLAAIVFAIGLAVASLYVVYIAPVLFAEVLVDGALSYALYRHLKGQDPQHWLASTVRRTALPFLATACFVAVMGAVLASYAPGATSIGQVMAQAGARKAR